MEKKLSELSNSQQSVQTLSLWLIHHRKHANTIVRVWYNELKKGKGGTFCPRHIHKFSKRVYVMFCSFGLKVNSTGKLANKLIIEPSSIS